MFSTFQSLIGRKQLNFEKNFTFHNNNCFLKHFLSILAWGEGTMKFHSHERQARVREKILELSRVAQNCVKQVWDILIQNPEPRNDS